MFSLIVFLTITLTLMLAGLGVGLLFHFGVIREHNKSVILGAVAAASILAGTTLSRFVGKQSLAAITDLSKAAKEVARGNFNVTLKEDSKIDELREMAHNFNRMAKELAGTELLRTDFVENVSHEFKTPLSAIEGYATLLQRKDLTTGKSREYTEKILYNTRRLSLLTSNILLLSRLENQELDVQKELFCLDEQLREAILSLEQRWMEKALVLEIDLDSVDYRGSRDLLSHVWQNILGNAVKFAPEGGTVRVLLRREASCVRVTVSDNGPGMDEEVRRRVFEKFYQGDTSRSSQGSGLGLSLAKRIVDLHGGEISVLSRAGEGAAFTVTLPTGSG